MSYIFCDILDKVSIFHIQTPTFPQGQLNSIGGASGKIQVFTFSLEIKLWLGAPVKAAVLFDLTFH